MAYNGSGTFSLVSGNPVTTGTVISSNWANTTLADIANNGLSNAITKDGQTTITGNIPFASFRLTDLGAATARTDAIQYAQVQDGSPTYLTSPAGTNTITATGANSLAAYAAGQRFLFIPANTNTGATTININSIGAKNVFFAGAACSGGELVQSVPVVIAYDGTQFNIIGPVIGARLTASLGGDVTLNNTGSYFDGPSVAQGTVGTFLATGTVVCWDTAGAAQFNVKLWDGTTVIASAATQSRAASTPVSISLSGYITSPAGNIRISVNDQTATTGAILYNNSGNSKDGTISVVRIA